MSTRIGVLTVSDRASAGIYDDKSGPAIIDVLRQLLISDWMPVRRIVPDDAAQIKGALIDLVDQEHCSLVLTTGGTGPSLRDITPEITELVCEKLMVGFGELMRQKSLEKVPTAILSRQTAGIRGHALIVNLPGKPASIDLCLKAVFPAIPYCLDLIGGDRLETNLEVCLAFRPNTKQVSNPANLTSANRLET